jgi:hypothetical protein
LSDHLGHEAEACAARLYKTMVEDAADDEWAEDPDGAAREDMSDWDWDQLNPKAEGA